MLKRFYKYLIITLFIIFCGDAFSQSSQEPFGKNRVQYKNFVWKYITTTNFEVYYYSNSIDLAIKTATYAEDDFRRITEVLGYNPPEKIKIIVYNSESDKQQSNIGLADQEIMIGGQTVLVKSKIEIAFKGSQIELMEDISYGIAKITINAVMFGGNLKDVVKSTYLMNLPEWYIDGAASYIAKGWSQEMDNFMLNKVLSNSIKNPTSYTGEDARLIGHSIWNFISREYGENNIASLIGLTRAFRDEKESIESNLGVSFKDFLQNWETYYSNINTHIGNNYKQLPQEAVVKSARKKALLYSLSISPNGSKIAYVQNFKGKYKLKITNIETQTTTTILRGGYKRDDQTIDYVHPVTNWKTNEIVSAIYYKQGKLVQKNFDLKNHKKSKQKLGEYSNIQSFSFSKSGDQMVMSADKSGQTDIYLINLSSSTTTQITNDAFDDLDPVFTDDNRIVFSSNRQEDTLSKNSGLPEYTAVYQLFAFQAANKRILQRIPFNGNCTMPKVANNEIYFLNEEKGISNIYKLNTENNFIQVTENPVDISYFDIAKENSTYSFLSQRKNKPSLYVTNNVAGFALDKYPLTERRNNVQTEQIYNSAPADNVNFNFSATEEDDFGKLTFESEIKKDTAQINKETSIFSPLFTLTKYTGPIKYPNPFSTDKIISTIMVDPMRGLGALLEGGMSDILGNHRIDAGGFIAFDFRSTRLFGEYRYVKKRVDFKVRYDRQSLNPYNDYAVHRYVLNKFSGTISYPLSVYQRIGFSPSFVTTTYRETTSFATIAQKDKTATYEALKGEYVYDNTLVTGVNMLKGTRFKFSTEYFICNQNSFKDFGLLNFDFRKYIPIHKELVFATRLSYGHFFGKAPKNFLLGGMDNWLLSNREFYSNSNATIDNPLTIDPGVENSDLLFTQYVTSIRGFKYNSQFGSKHVMLNAELRLPIVTYLYNGTIGSNFLRNLQLIGFTDIGSSFNGKLTAENNINNKTVAGYPFSAAVTNYESPFLIGFGGGIRTTLLGYYLKTDIGWGLQNNILSRPQLYLTFGYDF